MDMEGRGAIVGSAGPGLQLGPAPYTYLMSNWHHSRDEAYQPSLFSSLFYFCTPIVLVTSLNLWYKMLLSADQSDCAKQDLFKKQQRKVELAFYHHLMTSVFKMARSLQPSTLWIKLICHKLARITSTNKLSNYFRNRSLKKSLRYSCAPHQLC